MTRSEKPRAVLGGRPLFFLLLVAAAVAFFLIPRGPKGPSVLIITIDTLRADAVTAEDMPALTELAQSGITFLKARTPCPLTLPAHTSILTGVDPRAHGLRTNTAVPLPPADGRDFAMLAEQFREQGYATAAFVASAVLGARYGLDRGFDQYREPDPQRAGTVEFSWLDAAEQVERVKAWMASRPDRPYFVWVHLWDPHAPYREYDGDERRPGTSADTDDPKTLYRGEVRRADHAVERLLDLVDLETTVVVVTSDHGEALGEHGEKTHGHLCYGATMDVPLVLAGAGVAAGRRVERVASLLDVAPTLRRLCDLGEPRGEDLLALPQDRIVVGESLYAYALYRWQQQTVAYDGVHTLHDPTGQWFGDPGEIKPLPGTPPTHLDKAITDYRSGPSRGRAGAAYSPAGSPYGSVNVPATFLKPKENRALPAVAPRLARTESVLNALNGGIALASQGVSQAPAIVRKALERLDELEKTDPANPAFALARARAQMIVFGRMKAALAALEEAVSRGYPRGALEPLFRRARGG